MGICALVPSDQNGFRPRVFGMGILVDDRMVVTCAHVISFAFGLPTQKEPGQSAVRVCFPFAKGYPCIQGTVAGWIPAGRREDGKLSDMALIQLEEDAPKSVERAVLRPYFIAAEARVYGFRGKKVGEGAWRSHPDGEWALGNIVGPQPGGRAQFDGLRWGAGVERGFSGGGIYDPFQDAVVGMVVESDRQEARRIAQFIDVSSLEEAFEGTPGVEPGLFAKWDLSRSGSSRLTNPAKVPEKSARLRRWQSILALALMIGAAVYCWLWWAAHQTSRLYDKGRQAMAEFDFQRARELFEEAEPDRNPLVRSALAKTLMNLGNSDRARQESKSAFDQSRKLSYQDRLLVEARYYRILENWAETLPRYRKLQKGDPTEVEYAVGIAETQMALGLYEEALSTIDKMKNISKNPCLDLEEGRAAIYHSDLPHAVEASSRAIEKAESQGLNSLAAQGLLYRGTAFHVQEDLGRALADFERAEKLAGENFEQVARIQNAIAGVLSQKGKLNKALSSYEKARKAYNDAGNKKSANEQDLYIANIYDMQGKLRQARQTYETALRQADDPLSQPDEAFVRGSLGTILARQGRLAEAVASLESAIAIFEDIGDQVQEAAYQCRLSEVHLENLELKPAEASLKNCLAVARGKEDPLLKADALSFHGLLLFFQGNLESALKKQKEAESLYEHIGDGLSTAQRQLAMAEIEIERDNASSVSSDAQAAFDYFYGQQALDDMATARVLLARSFLLQGLPRRAQTWIEQAKGRAKDSESLALRIQVSLVEARALAATGNVPEARKIIQRQLDDPQNRNSPKLRMEIRLAQGEIEVLHGNRGQGREILSQLEEDAMERGFKLVATKAARLRTLS